MAFISTTTGRPRCRPARTDPHPRERRDLLPEQVLIGIAVAPAFAGRLFLRLVVAAHPPGRSFEGAALAGRQGLEGGPAVQLASAAIRNGTSKRQKKPDRRRIAMLGPAVRAAVKCRRRFVAEIASAALAFAASTAAAQIARCALAFSATSQQRRGGSYRSEGASVRPALTPYSALVESRSTYRATRSTSRLTRAPGRQRAAAS